MKNSRFFLLILVTISLVLLLGRTCKKDNTNNKPRTILRQLPKDSSWLVRSDSAIPIEDRHLKVLIGRELLPEGKFGERVRRLSSQNVRVGDTYYSAYEKRYFVIDSIALPEQELQPDH